jgi:hypothetical protein
MAHANNVRIRDLSRLKTIIDEEDSSVDHQHILSETIAYLMEDLVTETWNHPEVVDRLLKAAGEVGA